MKMYAIFAILVTLYAVAVKAADTCPWYRTDIVIFIDQKVTTDKAVHDQTVKPFLKSFVTELREQTPANNDVRVAIVTFGGQLVLQHCLTDNQAKDVLLDKVKKIKYAPGRVNIVKAFEKCSQDKCFEGKTTKKYTSDKTIIIILSDGSADKASGAEKAAAIFKKKGASVFGVGIGIEDHETNIMNAMASQPRNKHVFNIRDLCEYGRFVKKLLIYVRLDQCQKEVATTTPAPTEGPQANQVTIQENVPKLLIAADICFIIDTSFSLTNEQFNKQKQFTVKLMQRMPMGEFGTRFALLTFAQKVRIYQYFNSAATPFDLLKAVEKIPFKAEGATFTDSGIKVARTQIFSGTKFTPRNSAVKAAKIAIVITDGAPSRAAKLKEESDLARKQGIKILGVGVGPGLASNHGLLLPMVANKKENLFVVKQIDELEKKIGKIMDRLKKQA